MATEVYRPINIELRLTVEEAERVRKTAPAGSRLDEALGDALDATKGPSEFPPPYRALVIGLTGDA